MNTSSQVHCDADDIYVYSFGLGVDVLRPGTDTPIPKNISASQELGLLDICVL